jgi:quercetin dioxygenase-like cupin family protein
MLVLLLATALQVSPLPNPIEAGWKGESVCELLFENDQMRAARCTFPPGIGHERHYHPPHWGYIVEGGAMQITDATGTRELQTRTGATWWSDGVAWHEALNVGDATTVYVIVEPKNVVKE